MSKDALQSSFEDAKSKTPPFLPTIGKICPGLERSSATVLSSINALTVSNLSKADIPVVVFSDVIDWCKEQDFFKPDRFVMSETTDEFADGQRVPWTDLCLMSLCTDAIIANSSYSWWGAWLIDNPDKVVVAPKKWFGQQFAHYNMNDLIPEGWIEL